METDYSNYYQKEIKELNNTAIYARLIQLEDQTKKLFLVECLFKFTHKYINTICENYENANFLFNHIIN